MCYSYDVLNCSVMCRLFCVQDADPELAETFLVNLTEVTLITGPAAVDSVPSVQRPGDVATVTIAENDNARGVVQFGQELVGRIVSKNRVLV